MSDDNHIDRIEELLDKVVEKKFLERKTETEIQKRFEVQEAKRFRNLSFIVAAISLIGVGTLTGWVAFTFESTVRKEAAAINAGFVDELELAQFQILANQFRFDENFSDEQALRAVNYLTEFRSNKSITEREDFKISLRDTVSSFVSASQNQSIDTIFALYPNEIAADKPLLRDLTHHYGQKLLSRNIEPSNDPVMQAFEYLESYAPEKDYPELPLIYRLPYMHAMEGSLANEDALELIDALSQLSQIDRDNYFTQTFSRTHTGNWMKRSTPDGEKIALRIRNFLKEYRGDFIETFAIDDPTLYDMAAEGELGGPEEQQVLSAYSTSIVTGETAAFTAQFGD